MLDNIDFCGGTGTLHSDDVKCWRTLPFYNQGLIARVIRLEQVLEKSIYDDKVILKWTVSRDFTATAGILKLEIRGVIKMLENETLVIKLLYAGN